MPVVTVCDRELLGFLAVSAWALHLFCVCPCGHVWLPVHMRLCACMQVREFMYALCMPANVRVHGSDAGLHVCVCASGCCVWACVFAVCACLCV